ncbi:MAG: DUF1905 domain-containing protein [Bacteroidales bacterium]|nr:DUF1905 domain-containing protein [Bacteroidales bacterium]
MKNAEKVKFTAKIEKHEGMDTGYIVFPYDVKELYGVKGQVKVKAVFDGSVVYRGSLAKMGMPCHVLGITKEIRYLLGKTFSEEISVEIEKDDDTREVVIPGDVSSLLDKNLKAKKFFENLSYTDKKEYIRWIETAQKEETRNRRIGIFIQQLNNKKKFMEK